MKNRKVSIGLDYGTESARALIADVLTGEENHRRAGEAQAGDFAAGSRQGTGGDACC